MATKKKAAGKKTPTKRSRAASDVPRSMPTEGRDPRGGLTAKGREFFNKKEGSHLRPGVLGPADTPEKMVRKGSFLRRHFTHPRGPMKNPKGEPTRLALSAHAWGESVPDTMGDAKKLADKGHQLLEQYHAIQDAAPSPSRKRASKDAASNSPAKRRAAKTPAKKTSAKKTVAKKAAPKRTASKRATPSKRVTE